MPLDYGYLRNQILCTNTMDGKGGMSFLGQQKHPLATTLGIRSLWNEDVHDPFLVLVPMAPLATLFTVFHNMNNIVVINDVIVDFLVC